MAQPLGTQVRPTELRLAPNSTMIKNVIFEEGADDHVSSIL
jgi:hypothetical protein